MEKIIRLKKSIRKWMLFFIVSLLLSGITAFAVETELHWVLSWWPETHSSFYNWLVTSCDAIRDTNEKYPYIAYGYDWLAFAHIVIAVAFIGPLVDPVRNIWIIAVGCIACVLIFPLAFIAGHIRHIPVYWRLIDCSFGIFGLIPLLVCYKKTRMLENIDYAR
ncbi:MAG: hypothetical protein KF746_20130 [Chitinophagaceae bacterium]|nr:hypothetical protein [Chitinophagaceae bacterium]